MTVLAHDPFADADVLTAAGIEPVDQGTLAARSQVLSCHLPATDQTRGLIDAELLAQMVQGSILINTGRGEVIDEPALVSALTSGHLAGAGLDVRAVEPPTLGRLEELDQVVLTPHVAGITAESQARIAAALADDIAAVLAGRTPRHAVT